MKRKPITIWRGWRLKGPLARQVEIAKAAKQLRLNRNDGERVRALAASMGKDRRS